MINHPPNPNSSPSMMWFPKTPNELRDFLNTLRAESSVSVDAHETNSIVAAIYTRKSRVLPGEADYSMHTQADDAETHALREDWQIYRTYADPNKTGRNSKRKELRTLIRDIKSGKIDVVVIHRLDRLYRNTEALLKFIALLNKHNVRLVSVTEQIDTDTSWGMLVVQVLSALAEMLVRQTSERTRASKAARARKGLPNGNLPLGFCKGICSSCRDPKGAGFCPQVGQPDIGDGEIPVWHPVDRYAIALIKTLREGGMSHREIATHLNENSFTLPDGMIVQFKTRGTPGRYPPQQFTRDSVRGILGNPFYAGYVARYETSPLDMNDDLS